MHINGLHIAGIGAHLPPRVSAADAVAEGSYLAERAAYSGIVSATVSPDLAAPEMAVRAGRDALAMAPPQLRSDVGLVLHTYTNYSGARFWDAAPYVALNTVGESVPGFDVLQSCNSALGAVSLAHAWIQAHGGSVLITGAERFDTPDLSRWNADPNAVFGDGAGAMLLSATGGFAAIRAIVTTADNRLEAESRGGAFSGELGAPMDMERLREQYLRDVMPLRQHMMAMGQLLGNTLKQVLADADCSLDDIAYAVPVVPIYPMLKGMLDNLVRLPEERTTWDLGRTTGHISAADHLIGLHHLVATGRIGVGDRVLMIGGGTGYTATFVVLEVTDTVTGS